MTKRIIINKCESSMGTIETMPLMEGDNGNDNITERRREDRLDLVAQEMTKWGKMVKCRTHATGLKERCVKEAIPTTARGLSKRKYPRKQ